MKHIVTLVALLLVPFAFVDGAVFEAAAAAVLCNVVDDPEVCETEEPGLRDIGGGHLAACHFSEDITSEKAEAAATQRTLRDITDDADEGVAVA